MPPADDDITGLLRIWRQGDGTALETLVPLIEGDLRRIARQRLARRHPDNTFTTTSLVQEVFVRLAGNSPRDWQGRAHFFALCAAIMRNVLVDHARANSCGKRGGGSRPVPLDEGLAVCPDRMEDLISVHDALEKLTEIDDRKARVVEMRFFGGMSVQETAEALGVSPETVTRDWRIARMWLLRHMSGSGPG